MSKVKCIFCDSAHTQKDGRHKEMQRHKCMDCGKRFDFGEYEGEYTFITHFNTKLKKTDRNLLTRANYCVPSREVDYKTKVLLEDVRRYYLQHGRYPLLCPSCYCNIPNEVFSDHGHFTEEFVEKHYHDCMYNYDLNIAYYESLDFDQFDKHLSSFVKRNKFKEIFDLQELDGTTGIYILVLDKYKQAYIGKTESTKGIKARILSHWSGKKEFFRLIFGGAENSILSIDSFGALDTTRIFIREYKWSYDLDAVERKLVANFNPKYRLNRVAGGLNGEDDSALRNLELFNTMVTRDFAK